MKAKHRLGSHLMLALSAASMIAAPLQAADEVENAKRDVARLTAQYKAHVKKVVDPARKKYIKALGAIKTQYTRKEELEAALVVDKREIYHEPQQRNQNKKDRVL